MVKRDSLMFLKEFSSLKKSLCKMPYLISIGKFGNPDFGKSSFLFFRKTYFVISFSWTNDSSTTKIHHKMRNFQNQTHPAAKIESWNNIIHGLYWLGHSPLYHVSAVISRLTFEQHYVDVTSMERAVRPHLWKKVLHKY